ncbi:hypothetical protein BH24BAC1_BH24BAC1_37870 [soil metagenome]
MKNTFTLMKRSVLVLLLLSPFLLRAQDPLLPVAPDTSYWTTSYNLGLNFNQASFSQNWRAGGVSSVAIGSLFLAKANYARGPITFDNLADLQYGLVRARGQDTRKTADQILLDTKVGRRLTPRWNLFTSLNFISQFTEGYQYVTDAFGQEQALLISNFMAPGFLTSAWGAEYRPREYFQLRLSPFAPRLTFVTDPGVAANVPNNYGVPVGERVRYEWLAAQLFASDDRKIRENLDVKWRYLMFANYQTLAPRTIDHRIDASLTAKITQYVNVSLTSILLYDVDQDAAVQYSQTLSLGLLLSRGNQ